MKKLLISSVCAALLSGVSFSSFAAGDINACYKAHEAQQAACADARKGSKDPVVKAMKAHTECLGKASAEFNACMAQITAASKANGEIKAAEEKIKSEWKKVYEDLQKCINDKCQTGGDTIKFLNHDCVVACEAKYDGKEMEILKKYGKPYSTAGGSK